MGSQYRKWDTERIFHSFITRLFPIGLPMPGSLFSFFTTLTPFGKDEADEQHN